MGDNTTKLFKETTVAASGKLVVTVESNGVVSLIEIVDVVFSYIVELKLEVELFDSIVVKAFVDSSVVSVLAVVLFILETTKIKFKLLMLETKYFQTKKISLRSILIFEELISALKPSGTRFNTSFFCSSNDLVYCFMFSSFFTSFSHINSAVSEYSFFSWL